MSSKAPKQKQQQQQQSQEEEVWRSGRNRFGWQQFRQTWRSRDRQWHFSGQEPGEVVRRVVHKHWFFLVPAALPLIGSLALLVVVTWLTTAVNEPPALWETLYVVTFLLVVGTGFWFVWKDLILWWLESYIITNKRIIDSRGLLQPTRRETPLEKVQQVGLDLDSPLAYLLGYGNVHLYLTGGDVVLKDVSHPREVKDAIHGITEDIKKKKPPKEKTPLPDDPELSALLSSLAQAKEVKPLPDADKDYPPFSNPDHLKGPRRTFGFPLRIHADVHYLSGEYTVKYIQRSRFVLYKRLMLPTLLIIGALSLGAIFPAFNLVGQPLASYWWFIVGLVVFSMLIWMALIYANYVDDVYILTNKRIIDIERRLSFLFEARSETEYKNIRDIKVKVPNVIERMLDIGDVFVETPGSSPDITLYSVDHPFVVQDTIYGIKGFKEKADKAEAEKKEKEQIYDWFGKVTSLMEKKMQTNGVPNLQGKDIVTAMLQASEFNMNVVVKREVASPGEPGTIIQQSPPPGTLMASGGEIHVFVSRRPTPLDMMQA